MAPDFQFLSLKKNPQNRHYDAEIIINDSRGKYEIYTNANMRYLDFLPKELRLSILDGSDCAFQKENQEIKGLYLKINSQDKVNQNNEKSLKKALLKFIRKECCEN